MTNSENEGERYGEKPEALTYLKYLVIGGKI